MSSGAKRKVFYNLECIGLTVLAAALSALGMHCLVIPADFAPAGVDGIATMLQELTGFSAGWFLIALNTPLLILAAVLLKKHYCIYTVLFTVLSSGMLVVLEKIDFYRFNEPNEKLLSALVAGAVLGIRSGIMFRIEASTGGMDIPACCIKLKKPHMNVETMSSVLCSIISVLSIFVYKNVFSVLLSIVQMVVFNSAAGIVLKDTRNAVEFVIFTKNPKAITDKIINILKHGATVTTGKGAFTEEETSIITTVVNVRQIPDILNIVKNEPDSFAYYTEAKGVRGNFRWRKHDEVK